MMHFKKILIIRLSAVGDVINVLPALKSLRLAYPSAHIAWLVEDRAKDMLEDNPDLDNIFVFPRKTWQKEIKNPIKVIPTIIKAFKFFRNINCENFDLVIDFQGNLKSGLMTMFCGKDVKLGFDRKSCKEWNNLFTNRHAHLKETRIHRIDKNLGLIKAIGIDSDYVKPEVIILEKDKEFIAKFINEKVKDNRQLAVIHPGTSKFGEFKRWPTENYAKLADMLIKKLNISVIFTWGGSEITIVNEIVSLMQEKAIISCKTNSLKQLAELIRRSNIFISGDTGPMHMASIIEKPLVAIFGPKDPIIYGPYLLSKELDHDNLTLKNPFNRANLVRKDLPCSPCKKRKCKQNICVTSVSPDEVFNSIIELPWNNIDGKIEQKEDRQIS